MADFMVDWKDEYKFERALSRVAKMPRKVAVKAAGKGATVVRKSIRSNAPVGDTGQLKRGIVRVGERGKPGKKVYDIMFDPKKNDIFQKPIKNPGEFGGKNKKAYYPASMEYGFLTRSKGGGYAYVPGYHFMRDSTDDAAPAARRAVIQTATQELTKEWLK